MTTNTVAKMLHVDWGWEKPPGHERSGSRTWTGSDHNPISPQSYLNCLLCFATADDDRYSDDDDDDAGWITPSNIEAMKQAAIASTESEVDGVCVACVTTDYAMQVLGSFVPAYR